MGYGEGMMLIAVAMLSLVAGMFLLMKTCKEEICCKLFYKIVAYAVIVISMILVLVGGSKAAFKCWRHDRGGKMGKMMGGMEMKPEMMMEMMKNCPMMKMMEQMKEMKEGE